MATKSMRSWTVLVYLAGDNNLDSAGGVDLNEMKEVGSSPELAIVAQVDREGTKDETRRYLLQKGTKLVDDRVAALGETNMGDPKVLTDFLRWGAKKYPAKNYMVVIWNHGAGWDDTDIYRSVRKTLKRNFTYKGTSITRGGGSRSSLPDSNVRTVARSRMRRAVFAPTVHAGVTSRAIAFDDDAKDFLDNIEMKSVLSKAAKFLGGKIAVVGMDACLMSMVEVAYQIRGTATVMVGSEEVEPGEGWPYDTILATLAAKPTTTPAELGTTIVARYLASYGANSGVTQAALDLARTDGLKKSVDDLASALISNLSSPSALLAFGRARNSAQTYDTQDYIDLVDFCRILKKQTSVPAIVKACDAVESQGVAPLVLASGYKGAAMKGSHGVSIYFPEGEISPLYAKLDFAKKSRWPTFLKKYRAATTA